MINEGWGIEDCYPSDEDYIRSKRQAKIDWWARLSEKAHFPKGGVYFVVPDNHPEAKKNEMILKHETGIEIPFRVDDQESIDYVKSFFNDVFPGAEILTQDADEYLRNR